ncbi:UNVERIFIED_CONTAM: hypothetical protein Sradi_4741900 [Sesamum radiatum]|uniref:NERD domain-containing protein n=1 Tax=Sesamum radiatum TaxID=300843 RepID=A0AAW2MVU3_SESRA
MGARTYAMIQTSFMPSQSSKDQAASWHTCFLCRRSSYLHCYTCKNAVCRRCLPAADFLQVKGERGFCNSCLKLVLLIEENKDHDSDGEECSDLRQKVAAGLLERPTVGELEQKAKILHKDITMHRIKKELALLQNLIDRANEKGWRREYPL